MTKVKDIDDLLNTSLREFEKQLNAKIASAQLNFERDLGKQVASVVEQITSKISSGSLGNAINSGIAAVAGGVISGNGFDARNVANSVASAFAPDVADFFKQSTSQMAYDFSSFLGFSSRNN